MVRKFLLCVYFLVAGCGTACCDDPVNKLDSRKLEMTDALETSLVAGNGLSVYDVFGKTTVTEEFGGETTPIETLRFRLKCDLNDESAIWVYEQISLDRTTGEKATVRLDARSVKGHEATAYQGGHAQTDQLGSFDEAVLHSSIPLTKFWGLALFPCWGDPVADIRAVISRIPQQSSTVIQERVTEGEKFRLREDLGPGQYDLRTWEFRLPDFQAIGHHVQRAAANDQLVKYEEQNLFFKEIFGVEVPVVIDGMCCIVRNTPDGGGLGRKSSITELHWISIEKQGKLTPMTDYNLSKVVDVIKLLDDGSR